MAVNAVFTVPASDFALGRVLNEAGVRVDLPQFVQIADSLVPYLWIDEPYGHEAFEQHIAADDLVERIEVIDDLPEKTLYRIEWADGIDDLLDLFINHEILVEQANTLRSGEDVDARAPRGDEMGMGADIWRFQVRTPSREHLAAFYDACQKSGMEMRIQQVVSDSDDPNENPWGLSAKQQEAVLAAYEAGYFDVPREESLTDLADDFDISRQAYSRRLMRGLASILSQTLLVEKTLIDSDTDD